MTAQTVARSLMCLLLAAAFLAAASAPLGNWDCVSAAPGGGEMKWTLNLREVDGKLVGTAGNSEGEVSIEEPKYEDNTLTFKVSLDSGMYEISLKFDGDKVEGNWKGGGETGAIKGAKKA